jgi:hypothetical protein
MGTTRSVENLPRGVRQKETVLEFEGYEHTRNHRVAIRLTRVRRIRPTKKRRSRVSRDIHPDAEPQSCTSCGCTRV